MLSCSLLPPRVSGYDIAGYCFLFSFSSPPVTFTTIACISLPWCVFVTSLPHMSPVWTQSLKPVMILLLSGWPCPALLQSHGSASPPYHGCPEFQPRWCRADWRWHWPEPQLTPSQLLQLCGPGSWTWGFSVCGCLLLILSLLIVYIFMFILHTFLVLWVFRY